MYSISLHQEMVSFGCQMPSVLTFTRTLLARQNHHNYGCRHLRPSERYSRPDAFGFALMAHTVA